MSGDIYSESAMLFQEYAAAFKGTRSLYWSNGLRRKLGLSKEKKDAEVANEADKDIPVVAKIDDVIEWPAVIANDCRGELLTVARYLGEAGVDQFLFELLWSGVPWAENMPGSYHDKRMILTAGAREGYLEANSLVGRYKTREIKQLDMFGSQISVLC
jgi:hypothetical protein